MIFNSLTRHVREGSKSILRNGWMSFASVSSIVISLFILGVFMLLSLNVNEMTKQIDNKVQIRVFLKLDVTKEQKELLATDIGNMSEVSKVISVSKEEGMKMLQENLGEDGKELLNGYTKETNPLPDSFTVEVYDPATISMVAKKINAINDTNSAKPLWKVNYGKGTVDTLLKVTATVRNFGLIIVAGLAVTAMFLISNTIKVTIMARQRELSIMKLVGATNSFIRGPFFVEGALIGLLGSLLTVGILFYGYQQLVTNFELGLQMVKLVPLQDAWLLVGSSLVALGILIGMWGSTISIRKFLKV
ncbi:permease-like cell division protein FtsX [Paenibacillus alvei]|uniref:Cell division protein FtsX n=1 Tax=Paenibacillus alvei TaxID=44250 RepID=A0ABT4GSC5_PAEAL|nr:MULTISPECIES: permease-like cell division protein FtsX [Paenibacillus]EJW18380.1 cell division protein FtsX [Paenibacillus alvei DSM 29]MCY7485274.1 permease-like cell division protein FtsX [Paenibacillus alvei]MCY9540310.1 permease-like cell division protein FtsX [Paenibacillus alvei]MCY9703077.1 permease-like cell division protein FtsX [Paenibacillus alvei]MCY9735700.1 permease-like cell division protein FtsX [Paenibacillus alvei]